MSRPQLNSLLKESIYAKTIPAFDCTRRQAQCHRDALKLTAEENELLTNYAESLDSDKSYVAGKIFMAFINQVSKAAAATPEEVPARKNGAAKKPHAVAPTA